MRIYKNNNWIKFLFQHGKLHHHPLLLVYWYVWTLISLSSHLRTCLTNIEKVILTQSALDHQHWTISQTQRVHMKRLICASEIVVLLLYTTIAILTFKSLHSQTQPEDVAYYITSILFLLLSPLLILTYNTLLVQHVKRNSMPRTSTVRRTHTNEEKLSVTITIVNTVALLTTIPYCITITLATLFYTLLIDLHD